MGMCFALNNCKMLLQEWVGSKSYLVPAGKELVDVNGFIQLDNCISPGGQTLAEVSSCIERT